MQIRNKIYHSLPAFIKLHNYKMVLSMDRWAGKVAIVTGASAGIGVSIVEKLVDSGVIVAGLARRKDRVDELAKKLSKKKGKLHAIKCDVSIEQDILDAFDWVKTNLGPIHILVNNAGAIKPTTLTDGETDKWKSVFDTNVLGLCICTREAVTDMKSNNVDGHIIHINSGLGHRVLDVPGLCVYPASKFAVTALTETLRQELNREKLKVKITSVSPGPVKTEFGDAAGVDPEMLKHLPMLLAKDVADAVMYTLSTPPHVQIHELMINPLFSSTEL